MKAFGFIVVSWEWIQCRYSFIVTLKLFSQSLSCQNFHPLVVYWCSLIYKGLPNFVTITGTARTTAKDFPTHRINKTFLLHHVCFPWRLKIIVTLIRLCSKNLTQTCLSETKVEFIGYWNSKTQMYFYLHIRFHEVVQSLQDCRLQGCSPSLISLLLCWLYPQLP